MPRTCTICRHDSRAAIEAQLVAGVPLRSIAEHTGVSVTALLRHKETHIPAQIAQAQEARTEARALDTVAQLKAINGAAIAILRAARESGNHETALRAIDRIQRQIELAAKLLGELDERPQVNIVTSVEWVTVRAVLLQALAPYPDARARVAAALLGVESPALGARGGASNGHARR